MTAIEETANTGAASGKSTRGSDQLPVGDATQSAPVHLRYGDAVHAALLAVEMPPNVLEAGIRTTGSRAEAFLRLVWVPGSEDLAAEGRDDGLSLAWSPSTGWGVQIGTDRDLVLLDVDEYAAPDTIADAALHAAEHGFVLAWTPPDPDARWTEGAIG
ncbi:hypothetical protein [Streptomyces sp. NPDC018693]|uniref:hypothetical protein n=1 Tax=unclassified Streptomyces TaxID=2593676 RepID=UPI0037AF014E